MTYQDALAVFSAVGRLVDHDETGALVRVNGEERLLTRGQVSAGAAALLRSNPNLDAAEEDPPTPWPAISAAAGYAAALTVCRTHAEDLIGWEEAWCPLCTTGDNSQATAQPAASSNTRVSPSQSNERSDDMNRHLCEVTGKDTWAAQDNRCVRCRPVAHVEDIPLTEADVREINAPLLADLIGEVGGEQALRASISMVAQAKRDGGRGDAVQGRLTRALLNLISTQDAIYQGALLEEYREFLAGFGIGLSFDDGVYYHDYAALGYEQPHLPAMADTLAGDNRAYVWQANAAAYRETVTAAVEARRTARQIMMVWLARESGERGQTLLGPNDEATRGVAAEYQAAGRKAGYSVTFELV